MADYYKILEVSPDADEGEIRTAYRRLVKKYHPDAGEGSSAEKFRDIQDAYELLSDPGKKSEYDQSRKREYHRPSGIPTWHIDLRDIVNSPHRAHREPVDLTSSIDDILEFLLRGGSVWP